MPTPLDTTAIAHWLPHRPPALWVEHLSDWEPFNYAHGFKHLSSDAPCFAGHFPGDPITPGVFVVEALAQLGALLWNLSHNTPGQIIWFAGMDACRFRRAVKPGDTLALSVTGLRVRRGYGRAQAIARVESNLVCAATISLVIPTQAHSTQAASTE